MRRRGFLETLLKGVVVSPLIVSSVAKEAISSPEDYFEEEFEKYLKRELRKYYKSNYEVDTLYPTINDKVHGIHLSIARGVNNRSGEEAEAEIIKFCSDLTEYLIEKKFSEGEAKKILAQYIYLKYDEFRLNPPDKIDKDREDITLDDYFGFSNNDAPINFKNIHYGAPFNMNVEKPFIVIRVLYKVGILPILLKKDVKLDKKLEEYVEDINRSL